nr:hypothetical protein [Angustibacter aerolatus]
MLKRGDVVGVFPEGSRGAGDVAAVHAGITWLALQSGAPIVPVATLGTRRPGDRERIQPAAAPAGRRLRRPGDPRVAARRPAPRGDPHPDRAVAAGAGRPRAGQQRPHRHPAARRDRAPHARRRHAVTDGTHDPSTPTDAPDETEVVAAGLRAGLDDYEPEPRGPGAAAR